MNNNINKQNSNNFYNNDDIYMNNEQNEKNQYLLNEIPKIRVVVRKRPINKKESNKGDQDIIDTTRSSVIVKELR